MHKKGLIYIVGSTPALGYAATFLESNRVETVRHPTPDATHVLLDIPSLDGDGNLRDGRRLTAVLETLPERICVIGGNLESTSLQRYRCRDLLKNPFYTAENARITAHCAVKLAAEKLPRTLDETNVLIVGWGRIGKCLARLLAACGANVTVAARNENVRAALKSLGYGAGTPESLSGQLSRFHVLFNTAPAPVYSSQQLEVCKKGILIDLASVKGLDHDSVLWARGLPGIHAPESSGNLIGRTILELLKEEGL